MDATEKEVSVEKDTNCQIDNLYIGKTAIQEVVERNINVEEIATNGIHCLGSFISCLFYQGENAKGQGGLTST